MYYKNSNWVPWWVPEKIVLQKSWWARGLRPDQTDPFVRQYDFAGNWTLGQSDKEIETEALKKEIKIMLAGNKKPTQKAIAELLDISVGKVNQLMKEIKKEKM